MRFDAFSRFADMTFEPDLQFQWRPDARHDHGACLFRAPWETNRKVLHGECVGNVRRARLATFKVLRFAKHIVVDKKTGAALCEDTYFEVQALTEHYRGEARGWLPHWQVQVYRKDAARETWEPPRCWDND
jgi:hypothetical protein